MLLTRGMLSESRRSTVYHWSDVDNELCSGSNLLMGDRMTLQETRMRWGREEPNASREEGLGAQFDRIESGDISGSFNPS
ncbi:hypothetical protein Tco_0765025 [Tanacetum coccineum]